MHRLNKITLKSRKIQFFIERTVFVKWDSGGKKVKPDNLFDRVSFSKKIFFIIITVCRFCVKLNTFLNTEISISGQHIVINSVLLIDVRYIIN